MASALMPPFPFSEEDGRGTERGGTDGRGSPADTQSGTSGIMGVVWEGKGFLLCTATAVPLTVSESPLALLTLQLLVPAFDV